MYHSLHFPFIAFKLTHLLWLDISSEKTLHHKRSRSSWPGDDHPSVYLALFESAGSKRASTFVRGCTSWWLAPPRRCPPPPLHTCGMGSTGNRKPSDKPAFIRARMIRQRDGQRCWLPLVLLVLLLMRQGLARPAHHDT